MSFNRLIYNDRLKIECMRKLGYKPKEIAEEIGFCLATVYNELNCGRVEVFKNGKKEILYSSLASENQHYNRMKKCGKKSRVLDDERLQEYLSHMLIDKKYSHQAIIDDINNRHLKFDFQVKSKTTIYNAMLGAKNLIDKTHNTAWDIFHIRLLEQSFLSDCMADKETVYPHYFATADSGLAEVLRANPIKMLIYYSGKIIPVRRYSSLDYFTKNELDFYTTESKVMLRAEAVKSIDFRFIKKKLIDELRFLLI